MSASVSEREETMMIAVGALWIQRLEASVGVGGDSDGGSRRKLHGNRSSNWRARTGAGCKAEVVGRTMTTSKTTGPRGSGGGKICGEASGRPVFKTKLWTTVSLAAILFVTLASTGLLFKAAEARYIHSTYRFSPGELGGGGDDQPLASNGYHAPDQLSRRQDDESEADNNDGDEDDDDQRAAASYRNQDDNGGAGGGEGGSGGDNYGDNESGECAATTSERVIY